MPDSNHIGAWVPDGSDLPERLDELAERLGLSRSELIVQACEDKLAFESALVRDPDLRDAAPRSKRAHIRQLIVDDIREARDDN